MTPSKRGSFNSPSKMGDVQRLCKPCHDLMMTARERERERERERGGGDGE